MHRRLLLVGAIAAVATFGPAAHAAPPPVQARAVILVNAADGEVLMSRSPDRRLPMASTTKLMTAIVTLQRSALDATVTVPAGAATPGGSSANLVVGERITVRNLITGLMVGSGNDAAIALAGFVGGSQARFVAIMNAEASSLGLTNTRFANPHGLDAAGHYSSVRDLVTLGMRAREFPIIRQVVRNRFATIPGPNGSGTRRLESENDLLAIDSEADGVKTGHTAGAGYSLVAHARRKSTGIELYAAMIGSPSRGQRARDAKRLLDWGFAQYVRVVPLTADKVVIRVPIRDQQGATVALRVDKPLGATVKIGTKLSRTIVAPAEIVGPLSAGTEVGDVAVLAGPKEIGRRKLVLAEDVAGASLAQRVRAGIGRLV